MAYTSYGTAIGQFTAGTLSSANTQTTTTSAGEQRAIVYGTPEQLPVIVFSEAFAEKAKASGIPVQTINNFSFTRNVDTSLERFPISEQQQIREQSEGNGFNFLPLLLIGGALLFFTAKR